jgi:hypothetical protein
MNQPTVPWWSNPLVTAVIGFLLGLLAEPPKRFIIDRIQRREARLRVYDDLGRYLGRVEALSLLTQLDLLPTHFPFRRAADILSRVRSPMSSRSNCANESRMFSVSRPSDVLVLSYHAGSSLFWQESLALVFSNAPYTLCPRINL